MIKIQLMSDLHILHWKNTLGVDYWHEDFPEYTSTDADVLVLAGDIVDLRPRDILWTINRLNEFGARYPNVLYVPGNHEFYGTSIFGGMESLAEMEDRLFGVTVLKPGRIATINGHRFLGSTMWQPRAPLPGIFSENITDHSAIKHFGRDHHLAYQGFKTFLEKDLQKGDIVVTHHAPNMGSVDSYWAGNGCNRWFVTPEMTPLIESREPALWMHGHMHAPFDYMVKNTRIVCNPFGYPGEGVRFNPKLVLKVP